MAEAQKKMVVPDEKEGENASETMASSAKSSLPITINNLDPNNQDIIKYFMVLLHGKKCVGGTSVHSEGTCRPTCVFGKNQDLVQATLHLGQCPGGTQCSVGHCRESQFLYTHWMNCFSRECVLCSPIVKVIILSFCGFLDKKGPVYADSIKKIMSMDQLALKGFITENI